MSNDDRRERQRTALRKEIQARLRSVQERSNKLHDALRDVDARSKRLGLHLQRVEHAPMPPDGCPTCFLETGRHVDLTPIPSATSTDLFRCPACNLLHQLSASDD